MRAAPGVRLARSNSGAVSESRSVCRVLPDSEKHAAIPSADHSSGNVSQLQGAVVMGEMRRSN